MKRYPVIIFLQVFMHALSILDLDTHPAFNPISAAEDYNTVLAAFLREYPGCDAAKVDTLRREQYSRLDQPATDSGATTTYLDYTVFNIFGAPSGTQPLPELRLSLPLSLSLSRRPMPTAAERGLGKGTGANPTDERPEPRCRAETATGVPEERGLRPV